MSRKKPYYHIKGQTDQLSADAHRAIEKGISYGKYMGMKSSEKEASYETMCKLRRPKGEV